MKKLDEVIKREYHKISIAILAIGIGAGVFSFLLHESVAFTSSFLGTDKAFNLKTLAFSLLFVLVSYLLTKYIFKDTNGSGIPQVKLSLTVYKGKMPKRMPFGKFFTSFATLCSGLSFGKEGPMVTIAAGWAHLVSHTLGFNRQLTKVLVASGATGGLAAAFNTPIAAVVFTVEEILGELNTKYLGPIVITSVIASVTSYTLLGNNSTFIAIDYKFHVEWHLVLYLLLGLFMSIVGQMLIKGVILLKSAKSRFFEGKDLIFIFIVVLLVAACSGVNPAVLGDGVSTINLLLEGKNPELITSVLSLFVMKVGLMIASYSTGLSGGLFMPVLFIGAVGGTLFAMIIAHFGIVNIHIGVFALLGMTSLLVSVIRTPFTAFVMLFEMTRNYELILPLMISSVAAYWFSSLFSPESIYETVSEYEGVHLPTSRDNECLNDMSVEDCMVSNVECLKADDKISDVIEQVQNSSYGGFPVLRGERLLGVINRYEVLERFENEPDCLVINAARYSVIHIYPDQNLLVALDKMKRFSVGRLPVLSRTRDRHLLGIITPEDIVGYLELTKTPHQA